MSARDILMEQMSWPEFGARLEKNPVVFLPCGATEQHGPHLPLAVDALLAQAVCRDAAEAVGGLVAPTLNFGYKSMPRSGGGPFFPGTLNLDGSTVSALVRDLIRDLARHGVRRICAVVAHYENQWFVTEGIDLAIRSGEVTDSSLIARKIGVTRRVVVAAPSYLRGKTLPKRRCLAT